MVIGENCCDNAAFTSAIFDCLAELATRLEPCISTPDNCTCQNIGESRNRDIFLGAMPEGTQEPAADPKMEPTTIEHPEDAETRATRRELKQSSISEKLDSDEKDKTEPEADSRQPETPRTEESERKANDLADQVSSPKKKRAHDQLEGHRDAQEDDSASVVSNDSGKDRATRLEPEKKRHRDGEPLEMTLVGAFIPLMTTLFVRQISTNIILNDTGNRAFRHGACHNCERYT